MSQDIDKALGLDDDDDNSVFNNKAAKIKDKQTTTKDKLNALKDLLKLDNTQFNTDDHLVQIGDFPSSQNIKVINYEDEYKKCVEYATDNITSIIINYIKSPELLKSDKLNKVKSQHIDKLADLEDLVRKAHHNLIMVQEAIDAGDMSSDMFKFAKEFMGEKRNSIEAKSKHLDKCEIYWENYAAIYGLESKDDEIVRKTEVKEDTEQKVQIFNISELNDIIDAQLKDKKDQKDIREKNT